MATRSTACSAWASAATPTRHTSGVRANPIAAATHTRSATPSRRLTSTVRPAAEAISSADMRFIRNAGDPRGARTVDTSQPSTA